MSTDPSSFNQAFRWVRVLSGHTKSLAGLAWAPVSESYLVSWAWDHTIRIWDINTAKESTQRFEHRVDSFDSAALAPDEQLLAASSYKDGVHLWSVRDHQRIRVVGPAETRVRALAWAPIGRRLAWATHGDLWLWDLENDPPKQLHPRNADGEIYDLAWSPDGQLIITACSRRAVQLWSANIARPLRIFEGHTDEVSSVAWSPDGWWFCSGARDGIICIWDPDKDRPKRKIKSGVGNVTGLSVSADGSLLAAQHHTQINIWRTDNWQLLGNIPINHALEPALAFHPKWPILATRYEAETIALGRFDLATLFRQSPFQYPVPPTAVTLPTASVTPTQPTPPTRLNTVEDPQKRQARLLLEEKTAAGKFDVFVSYSTKDQKWVNSWLLPKLAEQGIYCMDANDFRIGSPRLKEIEYAIKHCRKTILVLSESWLVGEWSGFEGLLGQSRDPSGMTRRLLPLKYKVCNLPPRLTMLIPADFTNARKRLQELERLVAAINSE